MGGDDETARVCVVPSRAVRHPPDDKTVGGVSEARSIDAGYRRGETGHLPPRCLMCLILDDLG